MERDTNEVHKKKENTRQDITIISFSELRQATSGFSESNKLGEGGFGKVYRGNFRGTEVAVKMLHNPGDTYQVKAFRHEVDILCRLDHKHLIRLIGVCPEEFGLVYELMDGGNLEVRLVHKDLPWKDRFRIGMEICSALAYLHSPNPDIVVHGDVKPENVFLDVNRMSKLGDFGICRVIPICKTTTTFHHTTIVQGSIGYLDPAFIQSSRLTPSADVYSFGMVLLRLLTKEQAGHGLIGIVEDAIEEQSLEDLLDASAAWPYQLAEELSKVAIKCCNTRVKHRPHIAQVCGILENMKWEYCNTPKQMSLQNVIVFSYEELQQATSNFSYSNKLGRGIFRDVYKGNLRGTEVAIERVINPDDAHLLKEFHQKVDRLGSLKHPHIICFIGTCPDKHAVVYEFMPGGNLEDRLRNGDLLWQDRFRITTEICSTLVFLHSHKPDYIVHGAIHTRNVLLDANSKSRLCNFGIGPQPNFSYMDPCFMQTGRITPSVDIYSFGMLLLHLLTNRRAEHVLVADVQDAMEEDRSADLLDVVANWPPQLAEELVDLAVTCCNLRLKLRPCSAEVLVMLENIEEHITNHPYS